MIRIMLLMFVIGFVEASQRLDDVGIANFQFGPYNRWAFSHIREVLTTANIPHDSSRVMELTRSDAFADDFQIAFQGRQQSISDIAKQQYIDGILVLRNGEILHESYYGALTQDRPHLMMSQSKSVIGLLAGVFESKGLIDLDKTVADYVPELARSGWGPDTLRTLLDMRDGADYTEDYEDFTSTVRLQDCALGWGQGNHCPKNGPQGGYEFFPSVGRNEKNKGKFVYKSGTTDVLGWVLEVAGGEPLSNLIAEHLWQPMGAEHDAYITVDQAGFALADGGMNATLRDMGRFGQLVLNRGKALGKQVVPAEYVDDILKQPGDPDWKNSAGEGYEEYYRSQWWGHGNGEGDISAAGIHGQYLHVAPEANMVVAVFSSWPRADGGSSELGWEAIGVLTETIIGYWRNQPKVAALEQPNVIFLMTDNQSPSLLGAYGNPDIQTPNIDRLAQEGMLFERAYATSGVCSPSRAVLLTGLIPSANGVHNGLPGSFDINDYSAIAEFRNLPQTLADAGYTTALVGKYHLGVSAQATLGFDYWVTFRGGHTTSFVDASVFDNGSTYNVSERDGHLTDLWTSRAVDFIASRQDQDKPFFLWLSYNGPYILPPTVNESPVSRFAKLYQDDVPSMPQEAVHPTLREWAKSQATSGRPDDDAIAGGSYPWAAIDALNNRQAMLNIAAETTHVDSGIGRVLDALRASGKLEDTVIVFLSDQGSAYGQLGLWGNSSWGSPAPAYNANMQIPLIFWHPGKVPAGLRRDEMINQFDIFPTILDYLGLAHHEIDNSPGRSFAPVLAGKEMAWENEVFFEFIETRVIQTERWKYTERILFGPNELYDMSVDPGEKTNLIDNPTYARQVTRLQKRLHAFFNQYSDPEFDVWHGGTGKARLYYESSKTDLLRQKFENFQEPFVESRAIFTDT